LATATEASSARKNLESADVDDDDEKVDPLTSKSSGQCQQAKQLLKQAESDSDDSSDEDEGDESANLKRDMIDKDSSSSDSSDDDSIQSGKKDDVKLKETQATASSLRDLAARNGKDVLGSDDDVDDFLVASMDDTDVFANAKRHVPATDEAAGDKSKGWATQRQLPGQFRKKQRRR
jgi:hypothetical protein